MTWREESVEIDYSNYMASLGDECQLCLIPQTNPSQIVDRYVHFFTVHAKFPYSNWDSRPVLEHLMIVPIKHAYSLHEIDEEASTELIALLKQYEELGYSIYARSTKNAGRSVAHQHTHIIKVE